ncbi:MAG: phosphoadenylyl-sulfate reductase [Alphaproteobacteria bacterium]|nr:phosphoadenylyl-sulfate reductase [Alphaproteobacteria bacterium]
MSFTKEASVCAEAMVDWLNEQGEHLSWQARLTLLAGLENKSIAFSTSFGYEDQALTHEIAKQGLNVALFTLDTGRLPEETYTLHQQTRDRYGVEIATYYPEPLALEKFVKEQGINGFYDSVSNRKSCCFIRKVEPLARALDGVEIWVSGLRRKQSENRADLPLAEWDAANKVVKFYPLRDASSEALWQYIKDKNVPYNPLHDVGYPSIGCAPCTRAVAADEHPRAGRWWWEQDDAASECGLHFVNGKVVRTKDE